jgi:hypothetical protein
MSAASLFSNRREVSRRFLEAFLDFDYRLGLEDRGDLRALRDFCTVRYKSAPSGSSAYTRVALRGLKDFVVKELSAPPSKRKSEKLRLQPISGVNGWEQQPPRGQRHLYRVPSFPLVQGNGFPERNLPDPARRITRNQCGFSLHRRRRSLAQMRRAEQAIKIPPTLSNQNLGFEPDRRR